MSSEEETTTKLLKKLPLFKELKKSKKILSKKVRSLEYSVKYLEHANEKLKKKMKKSRSSPTSVYVKEEPLDYDHSVVYHVDEDDNEVDDDTPVFICAPVNEANISMQIEEVSKEDSDQAEEEEANASEEDGNPAEEDADSAEKKEVCDSSSVSSNEMQIDSVENKEDDSSSKASVTEEEENQSQAESQEEEAQDEENQSQAAFQEEEAQDEENQSQAASQEEEEEEEAQEEEVEEMEVENEEESEEVYEIEINGKPYYVTNTVNSVIYEEDESGDISKEVGVYKAGKPHFY